MTLQCYVVFYKEKVLGIELVESNAKSRCEKINSEEDGSATYIIGKVVLKK